MDNQLQLGQAQSPRLQLQLNDQLSNHKSPQKGVSPFEFEGGDNPFSFYHDANLREPTSSDDDNVQINHNHEQSAQEKSNLPSIHEAQLTLQFKYIQIGENISKKDPIKFLQPHKPFQKLNTPKQIVEKIKESPSLNIQKSLVLLPLSTTIQRVKQQTFKTQSIASSGQKTYKVQLQSDMQQLKKKIKGKEVQKSIKLHQKKQDEKINSNKTFSAITKRSKNQTNIEFQQMRMLVKMAFQKKKTNYQMIKEWDKKRAESIGLYARMIEILQNQVDTRIKSSIENFQCYQIFFRQKAKQQQKYASSPIINTRYALQSNSLSKNVYINCSVILNFLSDENTQRYKRINDFIHLIRIKILKELTENHLNTSQRQLLKVRQKISILKSALKKQNSQTEEKANELANLFTEQSSNITNKTDKDFYRTQLSFLRKAFEQIELQKKLGQYCLQYYHTAIQEEFKRSQVIRQAMLTYSKGLKAAYYIQLQQQQPLVQLSKPQEIKLIQTFYSLKEMFDERTIQLFKIKNNITNKNPITIESFTKFINDFEYHPFDSRIILLKQFQVKHILKSKNLQEEKCYIVITVDNFLHLFMNQIKQKCGKPDVTIKISSKSIELKKGKDLILQIIKREERRASMMSYFWNKKVEKVFTIRFAKKDSLEEFMDYISKLMVDQF